VGYVIPVPYDLEIKFVCAICGHEVVERTHRLCIGEMHPLRLPPDGWHVISLQQDTPAPYYVCRDFNSDFQKGKCPKVVCPKHKVVLY